MSSLSVMLRIACLAALYWPAQYAYAETETRVALAGETQEQGAPEDSGNKAEIVLEADPYYTAIGYNIPLTAEPIPVISSGSEAVIYRELIKDSLIPRFMVLEASVYPLPSLGTYIKSHSPNLYRKAEIGHSGINLFESATVGFQEPWAVSMFFGNVAKLMRPREKRKGENYGYTGYLFSAGNKHIKDNTLIADNWYEFEWKIKGKLDYENEKLSWSFRGGARFNENHYVNDVAYVSLHRSNLDIRYSFLEWLENASYDLRMHFLQSGGKMVRLELIAGRKLPVQGWNIVPTLDVGLVWRSPHEYSGILKDTNHSTTTLVFRPSFEF